ncbi:MAG: TIGR04282 family arsenosugar biosynthesis glycosyltransferase [Burkholderiaceae bacterium]
MKQSTETTTIAVAIVCKTPQPGQSKTRLSPPLQPDECADLSACFIQDLARTVATLARAGDVNGYALYTPIGTEARLRTLLPDGFAIHPQEGDGFGERLLYGTRDLLVDHAGAILINSDSPTMPLAILRAAVDALKSGDNVVLSPAADGGYTLIGLSRLHARLFEDIPWSTSVVHRLTMERAAEIGLNVVSVPGWYDVDDAASLQMLEDEFAGRRPSFAEAMGADAPATRRFLAARNRQVVRA